MSPSVLSDPPRSQPAGHGVWLASVRLSGPAEGRESGGHTPGRLRLDFTPGSAEPRRSAGGAVEVLFDGTLYDRGELASLLGLTAADRYDDAQLVEQAYLSWGEDFPSHLKGIFACCVFDRRSERLLAARDRVGVYPLFYSRRRGELLFSTTVEAFGSFSGRPTAVDPAVIAGVLARHHPELEQTFHQGVSRVPPGSMLLSDRSGLRVERYWRLPPVGAGANWVDERELPEFGRLLDQAVGRALSEGPAGIFLSGGLDSVSVAAAAVEHCRVKGIQDPHALSLLFPGDVNEEPIQRGVAERLGIPLTTMELLAVVGEKGLVRAALDFAVASPAPPQNVWLPAYTKLATAGKQAGCASILTGGGGDEWLTVTPLLAADLIASGDVGGLARFATALQRSLRLPTLPLWRNLIWTNGLRPLLRANYRQLQSAAVPALERRRAERAIAARLEALPSWLAPDARLRAGLERGLLERARARSQRPAKPGPGGYYFAQLEHSLRHPLFALDIEEIFETGRRWGMRQFDIYWDADLIEFLYRVPPHLLNRGGRSKGLVREDLSRRFPGLGFDRQKKLLSRNFFAETLFDESAAAWRELGGAQALSQLGIVEPEGLERFMAEAIERRDMRHIDDLWRILSLESWVRPRI